MHLITLHDNLKPQYAISPITNLSCLERSLYSLTRDFEKSQNKCKWFNIQSNFFIMITCNYANVDSVAHANHFIKSNWICVRDLLVFYLKTTFLNSLKIMKKSPITKNSDKGCWTSLQISSSKSARLSRRQIRHSTWGDCNSSPWWHIPWSV